MWPRPPPFSSRCGSLEAGLSYPGVNGAILAFFLAETCGVTSWLEFARMTIDEYQRFTMALPQQDIRVPEHVWNPHRFGPGHLNTIDAAWALAKSDLNTIDAIWALRRAADAGGDNLSTEALSMVSDDSDL